MMIRICFVTTVSVTQKAFVVDTAKFLHGTGMFDVSMMCNDDEDFRKLLPSYIHFYPIPMRRGFNFDAPKAISKMKKIFSKEKFDIVQYSTPNASFYASVAAKIAKIPVRLYCQWGIAYVGFSGIKRKIFKFIERTVCFFSTAVEPDSNGNFVFSQSEGLYSTDKGHVVWNGSASGVNLSKFDIKHKEEWRKEIRNKYGISDGCIVFAFVGRLNRDKGINELFEAFRHLLEVGHDVYLLMVGDNKKEGNISDELYQWSTEEPHVIYCGFTNQVEKYLAASDIYVLPSYREGFGSAVIEAEAMRVPVIITDIPGLTDAMQKDRTGLVVIKGDIGNLESAMERLYQDKELRLTMGRTASEFASKKFEQTMLFNKIYEDRVNLIQESLFD